MKRIDLLILSALMLSVSAAFASEEKIEIAIAELGTSHLDGNYVVNEMLEEFGCFIKGTLEEAGAKIAPVRQFRNSDAIDLGEPSDELVKALLEVNCDANEKIDVDFSLGFAVVVRPITVGSGYFSVLNTKSYAVLDGVGYQYELGTVQSIGKDEKKQLLESGKFPFSGIVWKNLGSSEPKVIWNPRR